MLKQWLLGLLAVATVVGTVTLVATVTDGAGLLQHVGGRKPLTPTAALLTFGIVVIVVGAGVLVRWLIKMMRPGTRTP